MRESDTCKSGTGAPGKTVLIYLLLAAGTLAAYWPVLNCEFVNIDDWAYVTDNSHVKAGLTWSSVVWAFRSTVAGNWHPLTCLSHILDCQLYGLRAGGHHFTNLLFHVANTLLLFGVLQRLTRAIWRSALVAALFAVHPLRVESVAWVAERKDVLSAFFFMLTLGAYGRFAEIRNPKSENRSPKQETENTARAGVPSLGGEVRLSSARLWYLTAMVMFALGLMSKPMLVTLPFVLLLLDYWPLRRFTNPSLQFSSPPILRLVLEKLPFFLLAAVASVVAFLAQKGGGAVVALQAFPFRARLANAVVSYARYLAKAIWPDPLAVFYPYEGGWGAGRVLGAAVLLAALSLAAIVMARRRPYWFVGWFWFAGTLVPVIGLVQIGSQALADRYTYLPLIGIFVLCSWGLGELLAPRVGRRVVAIGATVLLLGFAVVTRLQLRHWKNSQALFEHAVQVTAHNARAQYCLGFILETQGKTAEAFGRYAEAIRDLPDFTEAHCGLAGIWAGQSKLEASANEYRAALRCQSDFPQAHYGLAEVLAKQGQGDQAIIHYTAALRSRPDYAEAHYQLATLLTRKMDIGQAIVHYREALRLKPDWLEALNNLAWILATQPDERHRNGAEAVRLAARAVELTGTNNSGALDTLGAASAEAGRFPAAVETARRALAAATAAGQNDLAAQIRSRLELYQAGRAYREP